MVSCAHNPHTVVFDFDGTIHDTMRIYEPAFNVGYQTLVDRGLAEPHTFTRDELRWNVGLTAREAWAMIEPNLTWEQVQPSTEVVGDVMLAMMAAGQGGLYEGVPAMLDEVKEAGHTLVFLSNCGTRYKDAAREAYGLDRWFSAYYAAEENDWQPKERVFELICARFPGPYIAVGDRYKDIALADAHDLACVGCLYGFGAPEELATATCHAHRPHEIAGLIERICRERLGARG